MCWNVHRVARVPDAAGGPPHRASRPVGRVWPSIVLLILLLALPLRAPASIALAAQWPQHPAAAPLPAQDAGTPRLFLPAIRREPGWTPIPGASYAALCMDCVAGWQPTDLPAEEHPDLNLGLLGYLSTDGARDLVDYGGAADAGAPRLTGLFPSPRAPTFVGVYRLRGWDWERESLGGAISDPPVTLVEIATAPGETIHVPRAGREIGDGYQVVVLYADEERITLKYTREDNVVRGYTLHLEGLRVDPALVALYRALNAGGRRALPALRAGQAFARAHGVSLGVAIRDSGRLLDPRSRKDWWPDV